MAGRGRQEHIFHRPTFYEDKGDAFRALDRLFVRIVDGLEKLHVATD